MDRDFKRRIAVLGILIVVFLGVFGVARHYSTAIVAFVVEQALLQRIPEGISQGTVQAKFDALLAATPEDARLSRLISLSTYLEKVQKLSPEEFNRLLAINATTPSRGALNN
jgi:hypothetical protein